MAEESDINEGLTRREVLKKGAMLSGALIWAVPTVQRVGIVAAQAEEVSRICKPQTPVSAQANQGLRRNGTAVRLDRSNSSAALSGPDGVYFSLGFGGWIKLNFGDKVFTLGGANVLIVEVTNNAGTYPEEKALVEVSTNGSSWTSIGTASSKNATNKFAVLGMDSFKYVRLTDTTNIGSFPLADFPFADGFDVDVVKVTCEE